MSGFFCVYHRDNAPLPLSTLADMGQAMRHRGSDGIYTWHDGCVGLGLCCFDTTPGSGAAQLPLLDRTAGLVITADARLDNRDELFSHLGVTGESRQLVTDSRLLLLAYRNWGARCVEYLLGDFVFVIWDIKQQQVFCVRDHIGIKPFYYHISDRLIACASEAGPLLKVPQVPDTVNEARIADFLVSQLEGIDKTSTFYSAIQRLPPAHSLLIKEGRVVITEFWRPDPEHENRYQDDAEYTEAFQEILSRSVHDRLRGQRSPALLLSGGIDSAAIAAFATRPGMDGNSSGLTCYSAVSKNPSACRETHFINRICRHLHTTTVPVCPEALQTYNKQLHDVFASLEEPFDEMTLIILLYLAARENRHDIVLDGVEGDMVHSLPPDYPGLLLKQGCLIRCMNEIFGCWMHRYNKQYPFYKTINDAIRPVLAPRWLRKIHRTGRNNNFSETGINPEFADQVRLQERIRNLQGYSRADKCKSLRERHIQIVTHPYLVNALERYDRLAALCRVEPRHPLLDKRLVEFSCSLPWDQNVRHGWPKYLLRRACRPFLPADVVWRSSWEHLGWTYTKTFVTNNRERITGRITGALPQLKKYINAQCISNILKSDRVDYVDNEISLAWSVFLLASWLQSRMSVS